ncbi:MAG: DinB family protein [Gemmatimonadaceae bacterium]
MQTLLATLRTTNHIVSLSLADLTDEIARRRARGDSGPSIAWTVGHLMDFRHTLLEYLGKPQPNVWGAAFRTTPATDGADYPGIDALRSEWQTMQTAVEQAFAAAAPDALNRPSGDVGVHGESTMFDKATFLAWHEAYHAGVIGALRTAAGLAGPADLARAAARVAA